MMELLEHKNKEHSKIQSQSQIPSQSQSKRKTNQTKLKSKSTSSIPSSLPPQASPTPSTKQATPSPILTYNTVRSHMNQYLEILDSRKNRSESDELAEIIMEVTYVVYSSF